MARNGQGRITWVVVADGSKAVIMRNDRVDHDPSLSVLNVEEIDNPPTREQSAAPPGRMNDGRAGSTRKSAFAETDFHRLTEERFAQDFAARLNKAAALDSFDRLLVIAPPKTLGDLRSKYSAELKKKIIAEIDRDLTNHPIPEIERHVAAAFSA
jgi:protein required for attachment to host cells